MGVPSFSGRGGGGGQDRARGRHLTAANTYTLSAFGRFNKFGGGGGGGGVLSAFGTIQYGLSLTNSCTHHLPLQCHTKCMITVQAKLI